MTKVYFVQAHFSDFENSWSIMIGLFTDKSVAEKHKDKWDRFFKEKQSIFDKPDNWEPNENDYMYEVEEWEESDDYFKLKMKYDEIKHFEDIQIEELELNKDIFKESVPIRTEPMEDLLLQWDRDYKLNEII